MRSGEDMWQEAKLGECKLNSAQFMQYALYTRTDESFKSEYVPSSTLARYPFDPELAVEKRGKNYESGDYPRFQ